MIEETVDENSGKIVPLKLLTKMKMEEDYKLAMLETNSFDKKKQQFADDVVKVSSALPGIPLS